MDVRYIVTKVETCPTCRGSGVIRHPVWEEYWRTHDRFIESEQLDKWFEERGYDYPPDEEIECPDCDGRGWIRTEVDLRDALHALGVTTRLFREEAE